MTGGTPLQADHPPTVTSTDATSAHITNTDQGQKGHVAAREVVRDRQPGHGLWTATDSVCNAMQCRLNSTDANARAQAKAGCAVGGLRAEAST